MNALVYKQINIQHDVIQKIFAFVAKRDFEEAENLLIAYADRIMHRTYSSQEEIQQELEALEVLYSDFNHGYMHWVKENKIDEINEIEELVSTDHHNFLLAHATDPASLDDLFYEVKEYLRDLHNEAHLQEAQEQLAYYKKLIV